MELNINSPVYFKDHYGIDDEVYKFCQRAYLFFKDKKYIFPTNVLIQFASLNYGTLRGAIHVKTLGSVLNKFILPPLYFNTFITSPFQADVNE